MLSEIAKLADALYDANIELTPEDPRISNCSKYDTFVVYLNASGLVDGVDFRGKDEATSFLGIRVNNHQQFPATNLESPVGVFNLCEESALLFWGIKPNKPLERLNVIKDVFSTGEFQVSPRFFRFLSFAKVLANNCDNRSDIPLYDLLRRVCIINTDNNQFVTGLLSATYQYCLENVANSAAITMLGKMVFGAPNGKREKVSIYFDISDFSSSRFDHRIGTAPFIPFASSIIPDEDCIRTTCCLTGEQSMVPRVYTKTKLPVLGDISFYVLNRDARYTYRYGCSGNDLFPVGKDEMCRMVSAMKFITDRRRGPSKDKGRKSSDMGRTWGVVRGDGKPNLVIAYVREKPDSVSAPADIFAQIDPELDFGIISETFFSLLEGKDQVPDDCHVNVFAIRKISKGEAKLSMANEIEVNKLKKACQRWQKGADNHPPFRIPLFQDGRFTLLEGTCPHPTDLVGLVSNKFVRSSGTLGSNKVGVSHGFSKSFEVLISDKGDTRLLATILRNTLPLLCWIYNKTTHCSARDIKDHQSWAAIKSLSFMAILLHKLGIEKEAYMKGHMYQLGRLLSLTDQVQRLYHVSKHGKCPSTLLGSKMLGSAMANPQRTVGTVCSRLPTYIAWGQTYTGDKVALVKWLLGEISVAIQTLSEPELPIATSEADKAQLLFGFLARSEKIDKKQGKEDEVENE